MTLGAFTSLVHMKRLQTAERNLRDAARQRPTDWRMPASLATLLFSCNRPDEALVALDRAVTCGANANDLGMRAIRADILQSLGRCREAFAIFAQGLQARGPQWDGSPVSDLILHFSQGQLGDVIQMARFVSLAKARGVERVVLEVPQPLVRLLSDCGADVVRCAGRFDSTMTATLWELPTLLDFEPSSVAPATVWASDASLWGQPIPDFTYLPRPRIGVCWAAGPRPPHPVLADAVFSRNVPLALLGPLFDTDASFVSLQVGPAEGERPAGIPGIDGQVEDFADTAAVIQQLDLVITV